MGKKRRATLRSAWWKEQIRAVRHCYRCGGPLRKQYVKEEKCRRLVCQACKTITYINPKVVAGLIPLMPDGRLVLLKRNIEPALGKWSYPAGYHEIGESVEEAAAREALEEIGAHVRVQNCLGIYSYPDAGVVTIVYMGVIPEGEKPRCTPEAQAIALVRPSEIPWRHLAFRSTVDALKEWLLKKEIKQSSPG